MNLIQSLQSTFTAYLQKTFSLSDDQLQHTTLELNVDPAKQQFGDLNANCAMILAKQLKKNPREVAQTIIDGFSHEKIDKIDIAGPGFLNIFLKPTAWKTLSEELFVQNKDFFKPTNLKSEHYSLEFVSANPTGPLHLGHGRGGIIGDVLGNVLDFLGHEVTKEFYINDAGNQMKKLGRSFKARCEQECGMDVEVPEDGYMGEYLIELAKQCVAEYGKAVIGEKESFFGEYAEKHLLQNIKDNLADYGITYDVWFSERSLHQSGAIEKALAYLQDKGHVYEEDGALWFRASEFGDDKDRVVRKSSGELTYVAADIAYMKNKIDRGAQHLVMVLGHDHHGYVVRLQGLLRAMNLQGKAAIEAILYQLVKMNAGGQQVRMSKRAGNIVTLKGVIDEVGTDVARFFYLNRKADTQLEFDLDLALKKTDENPVYYVQYAYVRTKSILAKAEQEAALQALTHHDAKHVSASEALLLKKIADLGQLLTAIGTNYQTHLLTYYALELATQFHHYYAHNRVIDMDNVEQSRGRLVLVTTLKNTFETVFALLGISAPQTM